jgi:hypothetical protein
MFVGTLRRLASGDWLKVHKASAVRLRSACHRAFSANLFNSQPGGHLLGFDRSTEHQPQVAWSVHGQSAAESLRGTIGPVRTS